MTNDFKKLIVTTPETEQRIRDGIEQNRKGNFVLKFPKEYGGKKVQVKLKNHKFRFGANLFMLDEFIDDEKKNGIYREKFKDVFNLATLPFYWNSTEPEEGKTRYHKDSERMYRRPAIDLCMEYCLENGIEPREHSLCYTYAYPEWLVGKTFEEVKPYLERRMQEISTRYADKIPTIEVTNEMFWEQCKFEFYFKPEEWFLWCYDMAEKYFPNNILAVNDGVTGHEVDRDKYYDYVKKALADGCRMDMMGLQFHMFFFKEQYFEKTRFFYNLPELFKLLDRYASLGLPLEITEITIPAYYDDPEKEEEQADILEKLYSLWFSHPAMDKIIYWNTVEGYAYGAEPGDMTQGENYYRGGLLRFDMSEKPAFKRLKKLIKEIWTTNETVTVDENGSASFRGFYGDYEITVDGKTYTVNLDENDKEVML